VDYAPRTPVPDDSLQRFAAFCARRPNVEPTAVA
jgi:hypothetical protein